jgi:UDP-N-acetylmuramyl pentapeptide phosphotransferase/UDP-N-acetylglucosamine-1-phosphate transferase
MNAKKFYSVRKLTVWGIFLLAVSMIISSGKIFDNTLENEKIAYILSFFLSGILVFTILKYISPDKNFGDSKEKKHAIHVYQIPRIGGLAIFLSVFLVSVFFFNDNREILFFLASATIVFIIGLFEDYTQELPPILRLIMMSIPVMYILIVLNGVVYDIYYVKLFFPIALIFTIVSVIGFINAVNIIDGLNGLSSGIAILGFSFFLLSAQNPNIELLSGIFLFSTLAFFIINITTGKIFLGDGGSYLLGFALGELAVLISNEPYLSPWFPFALLIYPVWEVLFSIIRRKKQGKGIMEADKLHLHTLIYYRYFKKLIKNPVKANSLASLTILIVIGILDFIVFTIRENIYLLTVYTLLFIGLYTYIYSSIVHFKLGKIFAYKKENRKTTFKTLGEMKP